MDILFIPSLKPGNGIGHLKRCINYTISSSLNSSIFLSEEFIKKSVNDNGIRKIISPVIDKELAVSSIDKNYDIIVSDCRETGLKEIIEYSGKSSLLIGLDEGGESRDLFPFLIDTLPSLSKVRPNIFSTGLLGIKDKRNDDAVKIGDNSANDSDNFNNILVTFGGEDPENLTELVLSLLSRLKNDRKLDEIKITAVKGPLFKKSPERGGNVNIIDSPDTLEQLIDSCELVITSFGITAYEALYAGKAVLLVNPSEYHSELSSFAGIPELGLKSVDISLLEKYLTDPHFYWKKLKTSLDGAMDMDNLLSSVKTSGPDNLCPFCRKPGIPLARFSDRTYYKCHESSMIYMRSFRNETEDYGRDYFFDDYRKQYGKTYLEDFDNIKTMSGKRIDVLSQYKKSGKLLDVGCAYGPFLKTSSDAGYNSYGIDVSEDAIEYVKNKLSINAEVSDFSNREQDENERYDIITMWYVIEHFPEPQKIIEKVKSLLIPGGIFAFSTPNFTGISGKSDPVKTLYNSPSDHFTYWSVGSAVKILKKNGFKIIKIRNTGHHPERYSKKMKKIFPAAILKLISFLLKSGDTFEIYAEKQA